MATTVCVIGAGLAGGIVATQLSKRGCRVTLVERGAEPRPYPEDAERWVQDRPKAAFTRGTGLGGTSNFWHGGLMLPDEMDVAGRSAVFHSAKLPLRYSELRDYCCKALAIVRGAAEAAPADLESQPGREHNEFPLNTDYFRYKALVYPTRAFTTKPLIEEAERNHNLTVVREFEARKVTVSPGGRVAAVLGFDHARRTERTIPADVFVVCAGGLDSPKILLESVAEVRALAGLPIGKYLIDHPTGFVFKAKLRRRMDLGNIFGQPGKGYRVQYGVALNPGKTGSASHRNHIVFLRPAVSMKDPLIYDFLKRKFVGHKGKKLTLLDFAYLFKHTDLLYEAVNFKFGLFGTTGYVSGLTFSEQHPIAENCLARETDGTYSIKWRVSEEESQSVAAFLKMFLDGHKDVFEHYTIFPGIRDRLETAGHHSGGCRMAADPAQGVVDANLKVHGVDNLFVVDGSVLGYSGHTNTGLTISALGLKCVDAVESLLG